MRKASGLAAGILMLLVPARPGARADEAFLGSMSIPAGLAELAAAAGVHRVDPSTLPLDIVRSAFASPDRPNDPWAARRAAIARVLDRAGDSGDRVPLPLSPRIWRAHVLRAEVPDKRLASAILGRRPTALLYHGLVAMDPETLTWIEANPRTLEALQKNPGATAAFGRSIHIRKGEILTPGDEAAAAWEAIVGASPRDPAAFIAKLLASRDGRVAAFYDAVAHLDSARQRFVLGARTDPRRPERARRMIDAVTRDASSWRLDDFPFMRADADVPALFREVALDPRGVPVGPSSRRVWGQAFAEGGGSEEPIDAEWMVGTLLKSGAGSRRRVDTFLFAQRALASDITANPEMLVSALEGFQRYPALMLTLEDNGVRTAAVYAAAGRAAAALGRDEDAIAVFQGCLAIVDRVRLAGMMRPEQAATLIASLLEAGASRSNREALLAWLQSELLPGLRRSAGTAVQGADAETLMLRALAGADPIRPVRVDWEGHQYFTDLAHAERERLTRIRRAQHEVSIDEAIRSATARDMSALSRTLAGLVYAVASGEANSAAATGGPVWRRHRFWSAADPSADGQTWQLATEVFAADGWHLKGSLLRLDLALARLSLRRLDPTEMPEASPMSQMDRRTLAMTIALIDPRTITDESQDAAAGAMARGRQRVAALAGRPDTLDAMADDAAVSEWRRSGLRWLLAHDPGKVTGAFTSLEVFRLGGGTAPPGWGTAAGALQGCYCLRMPERSAWEEYAGRPATGQLATQLADVVLRTAEALSVRRLPALLIRDVAAFAMQDVMDAARPAYFDDWLSVAFAARDLKDERFEDYVAALTAGGPLVPVRKKS